MDGPKKWPNAKCTAISDPHMTSFNINGAKRLVFLMSHIYVLF